MDVASSAAAIRGTAEVRRQDSGPVGRRRKRTLASRERGRPTRSRDRSRSVFKVSSHRETYVRPGSCPTSFVGSGVVLRSSAGAPGQGPSGGGVRRDALLLLSYRAPYPALTQSDTDVSTLHEETGQTRTDVDKENINEGVWSRAFCCWPCSCWRRSRSLCLDPPTRHPLPSPYPSGLSSSLASDQDPSHTLSYLSSAPRLSDGETLALVECPKGGRQLAGGRRAPLAGRGQRRVVCLGPHPDQRSQRHRSRLDVAAVRYVSPTVFSFEVREGRGRRGVVKRGVLRRRGSSSAGDVGGEGSTPSCSSPFSSDDRSELLRGLGTPLFDQLAESPIAPSAQTPTLTRLSPPNPWTKPRISLTSSPLLLTSSTCYGRFTSPTSASTSSSSAVTSTSRPRVRSCSTSDRNSRRAREQASCRFKLSARERSGRCRPWRTRNSRRVSNGRGIRTGRRTRVRPRLKRWSPRTCRSRSRPLSTDRTATFSGRYAFLTRQYVLLSTCLCDACWRPSFATP